MKKDFPFLERGVVYLDNAATTQKPNQVIEAVGNYYRYHNANIHRGIHMLAVEATEMYEKARERVASFIGAQPKELVFTYGTTSSINLLARSLLESGILREGDVILTTVLEHHSNLLPWQRLKRYGISLKFVDLDDRGVLNEDDVIKAMDGVRLLTITGLSNVTGQKIDLEKIVSAAKERGILVHIDGAQLVPHVKVDVSKLNLDFLSFSAHKMLGPTGIGGLYVNEKYLDYIEPFFVGGGMIARVTLEESTFADPPEKFEAGTPNIAGAVGFAAAVDYLKNVGMEEIEDNDRKLTEYAIEKLRTLDFVELYGPLDERQTSIVSFNVKGIHPHDVASILDDKFKVAIRTGHHCAQPLMRRLGVAATCRASFYLYNTRDDVDRLIEGLKRVKEWIG
jgi:cysteine desulfurase/selenocysteine lyase